jgi:hypothetical protein
MVEAEDETNMITTAGHSDSTEQDLVRCMKLLQEHSIRLVVFDMDQTAVAAHSRGCLERAELSTFLNHATADFKSLVPRLFAAGYCMAIATHSDVAEYGVKNEGFVQPETHILGEELARALLDHHFPANVARAFFIVAYNPRHRGPEGELEVNRIKRHHMRMLTNHFQVQAAADILFFDDTPHVVDDCRESCGVRAVQVDPEVGFQLSDLLNHLSASPSTST